MTRINLFPFEIQHKIKRKRIIFYISIILIVIVFTAIFIRHIEERKIKQLENNLQNFKVKLSKQNSMQSSQTVLESNKNNEVQLSGTSSHLSIEAKNADIRKALQQLLDFVHVNYMISDAVKGDISLSLKNMNFEKILAVMLNMKGLQQREYTGVKFIAPIVEVLEHDKEILEAKQQFEQIIPTKSIFFQLRYVRAADVANILKNQTQNLLSGRTIVAIDPRTNSLWIRDTPHQLVEIKNFLQRLDTPVKQVQIEARIVNLDRSFERDLGIKFGVTQPLAHLSGNLAAANALAQHKAPKEIDLNDRLNFNLPQNLKDVSTSGRLGIALARLGTGILLDLELSAMESEGKGRVISTPRLLTTDQQAATIEAGEEIPYQEATTSGATSVAFKKAVLSLQVTPQITPDKKVILKLVVNQDKRSSKPEVLGVPAIDTRHMETQVMLDDGETIVLGGIYEMMQNQSVKRIPFLGELPVLSSLFTNQNTVPQQTELLIFVTPKIVEEKINS